MLPMHQTSASSKRAGRKGTRIPTTFQSTHLFGEHGHGRGCIRGYIRGSIRGWSKAYLPMPTQYLPSAPCPPLPQLAPCPPNEPDTSM